MPSKRQSLLGQIHLPHSLSKNLHSVCSLFKACATITPEMDADSSSTRESSSRLEMSPTKEYRHPRKAGKCDKDADVSEDRGARFPRTLRNCKIYPKNGGNRDAQYHMMSRIRRKKSRNRDDRQALRDMQAWTWDRATSKPPRDHEPEVGPTNELEPFFEKTATAMSYQGLPRELAQQLIDMPSSTARFFERVYRDEKEMELAGAGGPLTAQQVFQNAVDQWKADECASQIKAIPRMAPRENPFLRLNSGKRYASSEGVLSSDAGCWGERAGPSSEWPPWEVQTRLSSECDWPKWEGDDGESEESSKWQEEQLEAVELGSAEVFAKRLGSFDITACLALQEEKSLVARVTELVDSEPHESPIQPLHRSGIFAT